MRHVFSMCLFEKVSDIYITQYAKSRVFFSLFLTTINYFFFVDWTQKLMATLIWVQRYDLFVGVHCLIIFLCMPNFACFGTPKNLICLFVLLWFVFRKCQTDIKIKQNKFFSLHSPNFIHQFSNFVQFMYQEIAMFAGKVKMNGK